MVFDNPKVLRAIADEIERARTGNYYLDTERVVAIAQAIDPTCGEYAIATAISGIMLEREELLTSDDDLPS